ncbi:hypothetical protein K458DRAFT_449228 [Lentithecium fluviatile CBS 122367]|uniref:Uncharacterized protein n=1 Tax=Lentithecium fluviatile CBS 122367 TaxID=1168545 RepID=A0A6G1JNY3_9PLEO|nr:hypothetical protein K458DRAFT_449228 [Lentithecium fluviatile CBS 122367]
MNACQEVESQPSCTAPFQVDEGLAEPQRWDAEAPRSTTFGVASVALRTRAARTPGQEANQGAAGRGTRALGTGSSEFATGAVAGFGGQKLCCRAANLRTVWSPGGEPQGNCPERGSLARRAMFDSRGGERRRVGAGVAQERASAVLAGAGNGSTMVVATKRPSNAAAADADAAGLSRATVVQAAAVSADVKRSLPRPAAK